jgi:hypothetical protein
LVTLTGSLGESGLTVHVFDAATDFGFATVTGSFFSIALNLPEGANQLEVTAEDGSGNVSATADFNAFIDTIEPTLSTIGPVTPETRNSAVSSVDVVFSKPINLLTFPSSAVFLSVNNGPNLITNAVTISPVSGTTSTYAIGDLASLTSGEGNYTLIVNATGVQDLAGNIVIGSLSTTWLMDVTPPVSTVNPLPAQTTSTSFTVSVTGSDPTVAGGTPSGIASYALYDSTNGGSFTLFTTVTPLDPSALFTGQVGNSYSFYSVATDNAGNVQSTPTTSQATVAIVRSLAVSLVGPVAPNTRNTSVSSLDVTFSVPLNPVTFTDAALTLIDNGGENLITSAVTIALVSGSTYQINGLSGLTAANGNYTLSVSAAAIDDAYGNPGTGSLSASWLMDTTPPTSKVSPLPAREASLTFPVSVTGSDGGSPPSGIASYDIYSSINGGAWKFWINVPASSPTANFSGPSNTTYAFYSIAHDVAGNVESKTPRIEASAYVPNLTPPVTTVDATTGTNPSTVNSSTGTFTLNLTGSDPGGGLITYFELFVSIDGGAYQEVGPYAIPAGQADSNGNFHATVPYQGLTDGKTHSYSFYSLGLDSAGNMQVAPTSPNVTFANETFAVPTALAVTSLSVEHDSPSRSFIRYLDIGFNESDSQSGGALTAIANSLTSASSDIQIYKYDLNGDNAGNHTAPYLFSLAGATVKVIDHAIEIDFGASGIGGTPTTTAADGYYEVNIKPPGGALSVHHFDRLLGDVAGDGIVDQNDLNEIAASIGETSPIGWAPLSADVTADESVTAIDLTFATRSKGRKLGSGLSLG